MNSSAPVTSFTADEGTSLSSALAETVANLARFGAEESADCCGAKVTRSQCAETMTGERSQSRSGETAAKNQLQGGTIIAKSRGTDNIATRAASTETPSDAASKATRRGNDCLTSAVASLSTINFTPHRSPVKTRHATPIVSGTAFATALQRGKSSPESTKSPSLHSPVQQKPPEKSTRDGAPIIAGTAAAAMAIATAARIAEEKHGFIVKEDESFNRMVSLSTEAVLGMEKKTPKVVIRGVERNAGEANRITPEEMPQGAVKGVVLQSSVQQSRSISEKMPYRKNLGGMDILADIISHVPPMEVPDSLPSTSSAPLTLASRAAAPPMAAPPMAAPPTAAMSSSIHYAHQSYPQHFYQQQHQHTLVPSIPSYQEIYQEMGLTTSHPHYAHLYHRTAEAMATPHTYPLQEKQHYFGHPISGEIEEGKELYTRKDLMLMGGHAAENKDVHGSMKEGADSVVLCQLEREIREADGLCWFLYSCDRINGGGALCRSYHKKRAIRVFRSSILNGRYASPYLDEEEDDEISYRYDGLYMVRAVWDVHGNETEVFPCAGTEGWQTYFFTRLPKKPLDGRTEPDIQYNSMGLQELWGSIQKMRGVRRPKKFEIPEAPMKLPPMKRGAITGEKKDRKSVSYRPPKVPEPMQEKPDGRKKQPDPLFDSSSEEEAPEPPMRGPAKRSESSNSTRNERSPKLVSRPIPNKVVTPRPRMSSNAEELKKTISSTSSKPLASKDTSDSSDSEIEETAPSKRAKVEYPKLNSMSPTKRPNNLAQVISTLLPKRATAAKAEATNRDMLGKKKKRPYNRKSIAPSATSRKRPRRSKTEESSTSSSIDGVDPDVLTVGSRALVLYKGSLFKATIRKRRVKNGKHDFQIHYDGNKKSNVHWIPVDRIQKIISIAVDNTPVRKGDGKKSKRGGWNKKKSSESEIADPSDDESLNEDDGPKEESPKSKSVEANQEEEIDLDIEHGDKDAASDDEASVEVEAGDDGEVPPADDDTDLADDGQTSETAVEEDEEMPRTDTNTSVSTILTNGSKRNRITVFDKVEVASDTLTSPRHNNRTPFHKSSTLSSNGDDQSGINDDKEHSKSLERENSEDSTAELKYPVGTHVYVEYRRIFYSSTILQTRRKRKLIEYLVHYEGYKKASDRWVKESNLHEVNAETTKRFEEQRLTSSNIAVEPELSGPGDSSMTTRGKSNTSDGQSHQHFTRQKNTPSRSRSDTSDITQLVDIESGVAFLPGSVVFVELSGALYLAKMVKKRFSGHRTEYLLSYDGYDSDYDAWNSIHSIYEVNPQTKRVFNKMNADIKNGSKTKRPDPPKNRAERKRRDSTSNFTSSSASIEVEARPKKEKNVFSSPPLPRRRGNRKKQDDEDSFSEAPKQSSAAAFVSLPSIDMGGIAPGVEFLPGSTLFAQRRGCLCLAKMLKKRGKGDFMEYFIQFNDGSDDNESMWISTALVYEINPQTKRMFRQLSSKS